MGKKETQPAETDAGEEAEGLAPDVQDAIGRRLRSVYGRMVAEPLPDPIAKLLDELAKTDPTGKKS